MPAILEVDNLVKKYGETAVVKGVSFSVEEGEVFGLLGPNGAGKTQTISMITGVIPPTSGTARIGGIDILKEPLKVKSMVGLVPQDLALYQTLGSRANLNFFGSIYGLRGKELGQRVDDVLEIVALSDRQKEPIEKFSGGMKRRVNIAAGLVHQPRLLFLDEPTVGVDPQSRNHIFESVLKLNKDRGMSIIYTSHYMEEVELLCNRAAIIDQGEIIALDTIKNLIGILGGGVIHIGLRTVEDKTVTDLGKLPAVKSASLMAAPVPAVTDDGGQAQPPSTIESQVVLIEAEDSQKAIINVLGYLNDNDIQITALDILEPNLESVFLFLTGKKLRD
jgi:linearmycin/streptolysin S transport system ATP-binding protein